MISGSTDLMNAGGKMSAKGSLKINDAVIHNVQVGYPITADFDVADDHEQRSSSRSRKAI